MSVIEGIVIIVFMLSLTFIVGIYMLIKGMNNDTKIKQEYEKLKDIKGGN